MVNWSLSFVLSIIFLASFSDIKSLQLVLFIFVMKSPSTNTWLELRSWSRALEEISLTKSLHPRTMPKSEEKVKDIAIATNPLVIPIEVNCRRIPSTPYYRNILKIFLSIFSHLT
jgi:hypothetical protein